MLKTITQAAKELCVSRTKVYNLIKKLNISTVRNGKNNRIKDEDYEKIKEIVLNEQDNEEKSFQSNNTNETINERLNNVLDRDRNVLYGNLSDREYTDLKERITQLEKQIDKKDRQLQDQSEQLTEAMKANNSLIESNKDLNKITAQLNLMAYKTLSPPAAEESITIDTPLENEEPSWIKRIFKRKR